MPEVQMPVFPYRDFVITEYGAIGDGVHMNTGPIARAIEDCTSHGGGRVIISGGIWLTGPITLKNNVNLHVEEGALVLFSKNFDDYPHIKEFEPYKAFARPNLLSLINCRKVLLDGPTFQNSPAWCLHPLMCEHVTIRNVNVRNPWYSQNGDGLDLESCKNVIIYNSCFDVGDDAICMKSGKYEEGRKRGKACENIRIYGCAVYHGHGGFVVGSEMSGGVRNIHVSDCTFIGTDVGLRFKSCRGRGGVVENIYIDNIRMKYIPGEGIILTTYYGHGGETFGKDQSQVPVTEETPAFRNIYIKDTTCINVNKAVYVDRLPELPINNISLENLCIRLKYD